MSRYILTLIRRTRNIFPMILLITLALLTAILFVGRSVLSSYQNAEGKQKVRIGAVGDTEGTYMDIGFSAVKHLDVSRFSVDIVELDEDEAKKEVLSGDMLGYVKIPDGFVHAVSNGENCDLEYYTRNSSSGFGAAIIREIVSIDSDLVLKTQDAVFTAGDLARAGGCVNDGQFMDELSIKYISAVLTRSDMIKTEILGISDGLSIGGYYFCGAIVLFLLLWGISCCELLIKEDRGIHKLLCSRNIRSVRQVLCEYAVYLASTILMLTAIFIAGALLLGDVGIPELNGKGVSDALHFLLGAIPVIILFTSFQMLVYECADDRVTAITFQVVFTVIFCYVSGCFYPSSFFPETLQKIASVLPVGVGFTYLKASVLSDIPLKTFLLVAVYSLAFLAVTVTVRKIKTAGDRQ